MNAGVYFGSLFFYLNSFLREELYGYKFVIITVHLFIIKLMILSVLAIFWTSKLFHSFLHCSYTFTKFITLRALLYMLTSIYPKFWFLFNTHAAICHQIMAGYKSRLGNSCCYIGSVLVIEGFIFWDFGIWPNYPIHHAPYCFTLATFVDTWIRTCSCQ